MQSYSHVDFPELLQLDPRTDLFRPENKYLTSCDNRGAPPEQFYGDIRALAVRGERVLYDIQLTATGPGGRPQCITPAKLSVIFWVSLLAGASGISYQTDEATTVSVRARVTWLERRLAVWGPALLGKRIAIRSPSSRLVVCGFRYGGVTYIFTANVTNKAVKATLKLPGTKARTLLRYTEGDSITLSQMRLRKSKLKDNWKSYALKVYVRR